MKSNERQPSSVSEKTFDVTLSESELTLIVGSLWRQEHEQLQLAGVAAKEGNTRQEQARSMTPRLATRET